MRTSKKTKEKVDSSPEVFVTHPKSGRRRKKRKTNTTEDNTAKSRLSSIEQKLGIANLFEGEIYHLSFDCPRNLAKLFKEATKANGTSVCKELQNYALTYVVNYKLQKSAFGSTLSRVLKPKLAVENLNVTQYVQSRPRRLIRNVEPQTVTSEVCLTCEIGRCTKEAVGKDVYLAQGKEYRLCRFHLSQYAYSKAWRLLS
jgi:hypothetical protein